jgi:hypothetical protein
LTAGTHQVSFQSITGWITPADQFPIVSAGTTTTIVGVYVPATGSIQVTISPASLTNAHWTLDSGPLEPSGATVSGLTAGTHQVSFQSITGWTTPADQFPIVSAGTTTTISATYVPLVGFLRVTLNPSAVLPAGASWAYYPADSLSPTINWLPSDTIVPLAPGNYGLSFKVIPGWLSPIPFIASVSPGVTNWVSGLYRLKIPQVGLEGTNVVLRWPTNYSGGGLLSNTNGVYETNWGRINLPAPVVVNGQNTVYIPPFGLQQFFKLGK